MLKTQLLQPQINKDFRERKEKVFGIDAAPDAFLEKPVEPDTLMTTIKEYLSS